MTKENIIRVSLIEAFKLVSKGDDHLLNVVNTRYGTATGRLRLIVARKREEMARSVQKYILAPTMTSSKTIAKLCCITSVDSMMLRIPKVNIPIMSAAAT